MNRISIILLFAVAFPGLMAARDVAITITAKGANVSPAKSKTKDRILWSGNRWTVDFGTRSPCQSGKARFASTESATARVCVISVPCSASNSTGCGRYKYSSSADGAAPIDPELDVEP